MQRMQFFGEVFILHSKCQICQVAYTHTTLVGEGKWGFHYIIQNGERTGQWPTKRIGNIFPFISVRLGEIFPYSTACKINGIVQVYEGSDNGSQPILTSQGTFDVFSKLTTLHPWDFEHN